MGEDVAKHVADGDDTSGADVSWRLVEDGGVDV